MGTTSALEGSQVPEVASLLANALDGDPAYRFVFPDGASRATGLRDFFIRHLATHVPHGCTLVRSSDAGGIAATVTVRPPGGIHVPALTLVRGLLGIASRSGPKTVRRLLRVKDVYEELERRTAGQERYWHVHMMAVQPDLQGRGIGGALLREALSRVDGPDTVALTTHEERNVCFYQRAGFEVVLHEQVSPDPPRGVTYDVWGMRRVMRP